MTKEEILEKNCVYWISEVSIERSDVYDAMEEYAKQESLEFFKWVVDTYTTDESRLPLSGNSMLGGMTIFIDHHEYPISYVYQLYLQSKQ